MNDNEKRIAVRTHYGAIARGGSSCCGDSVEGRSGCGGAAKGGSGCGTASLVEDREGVGARAARGGCCQSADQESSSRVSDADERGAEIGYTPDELASVPEGANLGLGCGNPTALAHIRAGETVLDLGSGAGFDCFLAAKRTGSSGRVIGVDMTPDMIDRARQHAEDRGYENVEFRLGEIEHLPVADSSIDLVISNCVINLSPDKPAVFAEAYRALKPGGRLMVSDIVVNGELPEEVRLSAEAYAGCLAGAIEKSAYLGGIEATGFVSVKIESESPSDAVVIVRSPKGDITVPAGAVASVTVTAEKPIE